MFDLSFDTFRLYCCFISTLDFVTKSNLFFIKILFGVWGAFLLEERIVEDESTDCVGRDETGVTKDCLVAVLSIIC